jgi:hypothetical protein
MIDLLQVATIYFLCFIILYILKLHWLAIMLYTTFTEYTKMVFGTS